MLADCLARANARNGCIACYNNQFAYPLSIQAIRDILPHRYPMLLVDAILELDKQLNPSASRTSA